MLLKCTTCNANRGRLQFSAVFANYVCEDCFKRIETYIIKKVVK